MKRYLAGGVAGLLMLPVLLLAAVVSPAPAAYVGPAGASDRAQVRAAPSALRGYFLTAARRYALPPALLAAIATVESGFTPTAVGVETEYGHAQGMMQFIPSSWDLFNVVPGASPFDPGPAVLAAANHLLSSGRLAGGGWDAAKAVYGYNHDDTYVTTVLGWAARYGYRYDPNAPPVDPVRYRFPVTDTAARVARDDDTAAVHARRGARVLACVRGQVLAVTSGREHAEVTLRGEDGWLYHYRDVTQLSSVVLVGAVIEAGRVLGRVGGAPGQRRGALTFGISRGDEHDLWVDPVPYLDAWRGRG